MFLTPWLPLPSRTDIMRGTDRSALQSRFSPVVQHCSLRKLWFREGRRLQVLHQVRKSTQYIREYACTEPRRGLGAGARQELPLFYGAFLRLRRFITTSTSLGGPSSHLGGSVHGWLSPPSTHVASSDRQTCACVGVAEQTVLLRGCLEEQKVSS